MIKSLCFYKEVFSLGKEQTEIPNDRDRTGLPAWSFFNNEMFEAEKDLLFRRHWQLICHSSDIPNIGDFITWNLIGERALVIRGKDGKIRAFHNLCKHRGSRVIADEAGTCKSTITCPFHGWTYNLDGTLRGASRPSSQFSPFRSRLILCLGVQRSQTRRFIRPPCRLNVWTLCSMDIWTP